MALLSNGGDSNKKSCVLTIEFFLNSSIVILPPYSFNNFQCGAAFIFLFILYVLKYSKFNNEFLFHTLSFESILYAKAQLYEQKFP